MRKERAFEDTSTTELIYVHILNILQTLLSEHEISR